MKRALSIWLLVVVSALSDAQAPLVHARLEPAAGITVGQPVRLVVEVLVPNYFTGSPDFPEFEIENAIVVLPQERAQNANERINGMTYAGIIQTYTLYPQQPGDFQVPPAQIGVTYASRPPKSATARVSIPSLKFRADLPAAAQGLDYFLPTTQLTMQQKWSGPLDKVRAGDTITRTITVSASKVQAMLIPPLPAEAPDGLRVYPAQPIVQDLKTNRGDFVAGRRIESTKYLIQKEGEFTLPAIELKWWNLSTKRLQTAVLPPVHFVASPNPGVATELPPEAEPVVVPQPEPVSFWKRYKAWIELGISLALGILFLLWLAVRYIPKIYGGVQAWRERVKHSEPQYFRNLMQACQRNHACEAYSRLLEWLRLWRPGVSVPEFADESKDPELAAQIDELGGAIYANRDKPAAWKGADLALALKCVRKKKAATDAVRSSLPLMNPVR
jgi:hypothetical protein